MSTCTPVLLLAAGALKYEGHRLACHQLCTAPHNLVQRYQTCPDTGEGYDVQHYDLAGSDVAGKRKVGNGIGFVVGN